MSAADTSLHLDRNVYIDGYVESPRSWKQWAIATVILTALCAACVGSVLWAVSRLIAPTTDGAPAGAPGVVILEGQAPAVAATGGGRIIDVGCMVTGPVDVAPDGTGAFIVTDGGTQVACPQGTFRDGMTLRWPAEATPDTVPAGGR